MSKMYKPSCSKELKELVNDKNVYLGDIDTSLITDMTELFRDSNRKNFDGLETWDTSNVTTMKGIFCMAKYFNHPIGDWDVSKVKDMSYMFCEAPAFNQPLDKWDVSKVKDMTCMFYGATSFRQPVTAWKLRGQSTRGIFLDLPDYRDMESRVMCLAALEGNNRKYKLQEMIEVLERKKFRTRCGFTVQNTVLRNIHKIMESNYGKKIQT